jgi:hypothetical protein
VLEVLCIRQRSFEHFVGKLFRENTREALAEFPACDIVGRSLIVSTDKVEATRILLPKSLNRERKEFFGGGADCEDAVCRAVFF